ncbi:DUF935 domain-containing protein [Escherichia coli]|nr:DUF935 domain-containing protein [Escherichia coli]
MTRDFFILAEEMEERDLHYASVLRTRKLTVAGSRTGGGCRQ